MNFFNFDLAGLGGTGLEMSNAWNASMQRQMELMQMQARLGGILDYSRGVVLENFCGSPAAKPSRRDCPNCGAPYRPVCDYCGS